MICWADACMRGEYVWISVITEGFWRLLKGKKKNKILQASQWSASKNSLSQPRVWFGTLMHDFKGKGGVGPTCGETYFTWSTSTAVNTPSMSRGFLITEKSFVYSHGGTRPGELHQQWVGRLQSRGAYIGCLQVKNDGRFWMTHLTELPRDSRRLRAPAPHK